MKDKLTDCPCCGSDACYQSKVGEVDTWRCMSCGFASNTLMIEGSETEQAMYNGTAELIKDNRQIHDNLAWYPTVINIQSKGMIFPDWNRRAKDWYWAAVKAIPVTEEEKEKDPDPSNPGECYKFRMDMGKNTHFPKLSFMDAAENIGMFEPE